MFTIYLCINAHTQKVYVGQTSTSINKRFALHVSSSRRGSNTHFHKAIRKYGADAWTLRLLDHSDSQRTANVLEQFYIKRHDAIKQGYNLTIGGEGCNNFAHKSEQELALFKHKLHLIQSARSPEEKRRIILKAKTTKQSWTPDMRANVNASIKSGIQNMSEEQRQARSMKYKQALSGCRREVWRQKQLEGCRQRDCARQSDVIKAALRSRTQEQKQAQVDQFKETMSHKSQDEITDMLSKRSKALSKQWWVTDPAGNNYVVTGLRAFCKTNNIKHTTMYNIANGHNPPEEFKWRCVRVT